MIFTRDVLIGDTVTKKPNCYIVNITNSWESQLVRGWPAGCLHNVVGKLNSGLPRTNPDRGGGEGFEPGASTGFQIQHPKPLNHAFLPWNHAWFPQFCSLNFEWRPGQTPSPQLRLFLIPIISPRSSILQHPRLQRRQSLSLHLILIHLTVPNITALPPGSRYVNQYNNLNYAPQAVYSQTNHLYQILPKYKKKLQSKRSPFPYYSLPHSSRSLQTCLS